MILVVSMWAYHGVVCYLLFVVVGCLLVVVACCLLVDVCYCWLSLFVFVVCH